MCTGKTFFDKMADLKLVNVRKVYPWGSSSEKKKALASSDNPEYTDEGVVAVHDFTLDIADKVPVSYRFKEGSSEYWCGVQMLNHRYPVAKLEYLNSDGEFVEIKRRPYNYFESMEMGPGPFTFRATDIYGQVIVDHDIPLVLDEKIEGKSQFPL